MGPESAFSCPESQALSVLYEDAHLLVVAKPAGQVTQGLGASSLEWAVRHRLDPGDPAGVYVGTVHRLDRPVSGVLLWAKTAKAARRLAEQFATRRASKLYWALVEGRPKADRGRWEDWLYEEDTGVGRVQVCSRSTPRARQAVTHMEVLAREEGRTWLALRPETGRTHQLRAQSAFRGCPVLGDRTYGSQRDFPHGIALHARALTIEHPALREPRTFEAPLPPSWEGLVALA